VFAFQVKRLTLKRNGQVTGEDYTTGAFLSMDQDQADGDVGSFLVEDVEGAQVNDAVLVEDSMDGENAYCVASSSGRTQTLTVY
jgi:hypothetical protein